MKVAAAYNGDEGGTINLRGRRPIREINDLQLRRRQRRLDRILDNDEGDIDELLDETLDVDRESPSLWEQKPRRVASREARQKLRRRLRRFLELLPDGMTVREAIDLLS